MGVLLAAQLLFGLGYKVSAAQLKLAFEPMRRLTEHAIEDVRGVLLLA